MTLPIEEEKFIKITKIFINDIIKQFTLILKNIKM